MAKKKKINQSQYGGKILGRVDEKGNKIAFIQNPTDEEDIAPVKQTNNTWFKKGTLDDSGYAIENPIDAINRINAGILMTGVDALGQFGKGFLGSAEGVTDLAKTTTADVLDFFGADNKARKLRESAERTWGVNEQLEQALASDNGTGIDDMSFLGEKGKTVPQGLGTTMFSMTTGGLGGALLGTTAGASATSMALLGMSAAGNSEQEAIKEMKANQKINGLSDKEIYKNAKLYGVLSGIIETGTEMMFGAAAQGSQLLGIGTGAFDEADDAVINALTKKISNKMIKTFAQAGLKATSEGVEEVASGFLNAWAKKLTYMKQEDIKKLIEDENLLDSFLSGTFSAALSQAPSVVNNITTTENGKLRLRNNNEIRDFLTNLNEQEQQVVEREIENRLGQEENVTKKRRSEIEKQVIEDLDRGYINANTIRDVLGENYNAERDVRLNESFNEETRRTQAYENDLSKYDEKQAKIIQTAIDSGLLNNSNKTHDFVDLIAKLSADKGIDFDFTNNERIKDTGFAVEGKTVNGFIKDGKIALNLESNQVLNKVVGHEITHVLEGTDVYKELQNSLKSYLGEREWNNRIDELAETYKNVKNANIENELTSDLVGEYVFNDEKFVKSLSTRNPNLFQKIFDEIKYMVKIATAGSKEARDLEKVKRAFEKAYRETSKTQEGTQYSLSKSQQKYLEKTNNNEKLKEKEFYSLYSAHKIYNTENATNIINSIKENGFKGDGGFGVNLVPSNIIYNQDGTPMFASDRQYAPKKGEYVLFVPENEVDTSGGGYRVKQGYKPRDFEIVQVERDYQPYYELYEKAYDKDIKQKQNVKYSLTDNQGRELSKEQQEYFKDSKLRNENGELEVVYHTSPNQFTVFDNSKLGENTEYSNTAFGFFVTPNKNFSQRFGDINQEGTKGNTMEMYANITNPITHPFYAGYKYEGEQLDNIVRDYMKATGNEQFISDLETSADEEGLSLYQTYMDMMLGEDPFETADFDREELIKNGYDAVEFVEGLDKDVNYNVSDSNEPVSSYAVFDSSQLKNTDNTNPTSNPDIRYSLSVEEANTTQDNEGRKLNDNQLAYFKDSKAVDENGNLVTVYHTMTNTGNQFFEFNPVGTDFYRFGDQVVNYFTDNQDMSGSYADSNYKRAYTKPIKSMEDVQDFIKFQNTQSDGNIGVNGITNHYEIEKTDEGYKLTQKPNGREFLEFPINDEETKVALERVKANETLHRDFLGSYDPVATIKNQLESWYNTRQYDGYPKLAQLLDIYNRETTKLITERNTQAEQSVLQTIFKNDLEGFLFGERQFSDEKVNDVINRGLTKTYNNEQELIDNIQNDFQAKYQYAGYINMTNPYIIDTFGENWDSVTTERNEAKNSEYNRVIKDNETKKKLYNLAQESERLFKEYSQSNKPREFAEYSIIKNKINNSELREVVNDMGMFGLTYEGWLEAGKKNAELFGEEFKQTLPNSDEKISNYTESLNPAELELVQDLTIGEFVNRYGELYKENMKFGDSSSYFKDQFRTTTGTTLDTDKIGYSNMFDLARYNFDGSSVSEFLDEKLTTNDLVKRIIEKNNSGETNYDGLIMKNVYDYGGKSNKSFKTTGDLYVTFNSNQFKAVDNLNPTNDADIRYQLGNNEVAPTSGWNVRSEDVRLQSAFQDTIAPLQEQVQQLTDTITRLEDRIAPIKEEREDIETRSEGFVIDKINDLLWRLQGKKDRYFGLTKPDMELLRNTVLEDRQNRTEYLNDFINNLTQKIVDNSNTDVNVNEIKEELSSNINDYLDEYRALNEQEADELYQETQRGFENEVAPVRNNLTPEENQRMNMLELLERNGMLTDERRYEKEHLESKINPVYPTEEATPGQALSDIRDIDEVGKRNVKAYQYEHPEVKPYFQEEARGMLNDLNNSIKGERFINESQERGQGTSYDVLGVKRFTSPEIAELLDSKYGYTYDDIRKGLNAIIEDHGAENIAIAKRIELVLDDNLRNGYTDWQTGMEVPPNQQYLNMLAEQEWQNYFDDINSQYPLEQNIPQYALDEETDFSDVSIEPDLSNFTADDIDVFPFLEGLVKADERQKARQEIAKEVGNRKEYTPKKKGLIGKAIDLYKSATNEFAVVDKFAKDVKNPTITHKIDTWNNYVPLAQTNITTAQTDINGKAIGRSVDSIWSEADKLGVKEILDEYLKHWSNVDRGKRGKGALDYSAKESYKRVQEIKEQHPEVHRLAKDCWQLYRNARHNLRDAGTISQQQSDAIGRANPHYNPFISENLDAYFTETGELKPRKTIKSAKGGAELEGLLSSEEAMKKYMYSQFDEATGNRAFLEIVKSSPNQFVLGGDDRTSYVNQDHLSVDKNGYYLTAYENGEPITAQISKEMYDSLSRQTKHRVDEFINKYESILKPLEKFGNLRRKMLTELSPSFLLKNPGKDFQEAVINSKYTKDMIANYMNPETWIELANGTGESDIFRNNYGSGLVMGQYDIDISKIDPKSKNFNFLKKLGNANEYMELITRYAEFKASRQNGASIQEAMYNAREVTTNFSRGNPIVKAFNKYGMTFLNSSVQGFDKFIRNFSGENGAKGIVNSLAKAAIFGIAPAVFNELAFGSGDDKDEDYEVLPDYIKDNYYIIKLGKNQGEYDDNGNVIKIGGSTFLRIPKGRVLSVFGSAARRTIEAMEGEKNAFEGYWNNVQQQIGINNPEENNIFAPLIQAMGGRKLDSGQTAGSAWYGGDIIPSRLQKEHPEDQYDASIDDFSIWLGQKTGISPYKINYVLDQYTGGIGDLALPMITKEANSDADNVLEFISSGIKDQFKVDTITDNKYVSEFYDTYNKLYSGSKKTDEDILKKNYMSNISYQMSDLYKERREIQADTTLSKKEKYEKAQAIKAEINRLAKEGLDNYENISITGDYADINGQEYQKTDDGWKKLSSNTSDEVNSLGLTNREKNNYIKTQKDISNIKKKYKDTDDYVGKKQDIIGDIINTNLNDEAKMSLYQDTYKDKFSNYATDLGFDADTYLEYKAQDFSADKDKNGKSISGSKKRKVFDYINSMDVTYEQKLLLAKSEYNSFNDNNYEIIEYIENTGMDYDERIELYKALGFKVDGDSISW